MDKNRYTILPFNFHLFDSMSLLLVNCVGDYYFLSVADFDKLLAYSLDKQSNIFQDLKSRHFIAESDLDLTIDLLATKYRSTKSFLRDFTSLHMMVITLRCNHQCRYCQVTSEVVDAYKYDMMPATARRIVDYIFFSSSRNIKIEFQGGEPLLNWKTIEATIEQAEKLNRNKKKNLEFVICTNLTLLDEDKLKYINDHNVTISTSLDGNKTLHDKNRLLRNGGSSYNLIMEKLYLARKHLVHNKLSPLLTVTIDNMENLQEVVDEYIKLGFNGIFLRTLNPYGLASRNVETLGYPIDKFLSVFKTTLDYIIKINIEGTFFTEYFTTLLLRRVLTPFGTGFVDLQSPSGAGISGVIYDYNGDVYPADEARMLARMGDKYFLMGNVFKDIYTNIFNGKIITEIAKKSCLEIIPGCATCVYQPYCGADPIRNYLETKDIMGHRPSSEFCKKHKGLFDILFDKLKKNDESEMNVFWSWITQRNLQEIKGDNIPRNCSSHK